MQPFVITYIVGKQLFLIALLESSCLFPFSMEASRLWTSVCLLRNHKQKILTQTLCVAFLGPIPVSWFVAPSSPFTNQNVAWVTIKFDHCARRKRKRTFSAICGRLKLSTGNDSSFRFQNAFPDVYKLILIVFGKYCKFSTERCWIIVFALIGFAARFFD